MPLANDIKQKIRLAVDAGREVQRGASGSVVLSFGGGGFRFLVKGGKQTDAGDYYTEITGRALGDSWDPQQVPFKRGRTDYIQTTSGERAVRNWLPEANRYKYTALGKSFYAQKKSEYYEVLRRPSRNILEVVLGEKEQKLPG